jgi:hypothetical protein
VSDNWLTPRRILGALGLFDLDPCACPEPRPWATATHHITPPADGLTTPWAGRVWLNPPYSDVGPWLERLADHGEGTALVFSKTETAAWHRWVWPCASGVRFLKRRIHFFRPDGSSAHEPRSPSALIAYGPRDAERLLNCGLSGAYIPLAAVRDRAVRTWRATVLEALDELGGRTTLADLYSLIEGQRPTRNRFWRAKVRQQVQEHAVRVAPGTYELARAS